MVCSSTLRGWYPPTGRRVSACRLSGEAIAWNANSKFARGALTVRERRLQPDAARYVRAPQV
jgi:hypothetical protein